MRPGIEIPEYKDSGWEPTGLAKSGNRHCLTCMGPGLTLKQVVSQDFGWVWV
jgi:hypothetical protein